MGVPNFTNCTNPWNVMAFLQLFGNRLCAPRKILSNTRAGRRQQTRILLWYTRRMIFFKELEPDARSGGRIIIP
jgi:hypothetical protein